MEAEGLGGVLLGAQHNFAWLTAGGRSGIDLSREPGAGTLMVRADGKRFVIASRIEMARLLEEELAGAEFEPVEYAWEDEKASPALVADLAARLTEGGGALGSDLPAGPGLKVVEGTVARCRYQLDAVGVLNASAGSGATRARPSESSRKVWSRARPSRKSRAA